MGIPGYLSQLLSLVPNIFARKVTKFSRMSENVINNDEFDENLLLTPQIPRIHRNRKILDDLQLSLFTNYFRHPYQCTCWYLSSYQMILFNRYYNSMNSFNRFIEVCKRKLSQNLVNQLISFYYRFF